MSALSPGWMPTGIIACGNINLGKLKTTHILNNPKALDFSARFLFLGSLITASGYFLVTHFQNTGQVEKV